MTTRTQTSEIESLTSVRGIAACWVAAFHYWPTAVLMFPRLHTIDPFMECGYLAVPMFFVLSGYVIGLRYLNTMRTPRARSVKRFLLFRLARVYPVHAATLAVAIAINCRHGWPTDAAHSAERLIRNITLTQTWDRHFALSWNYPAWSISSEWFAYLLFPGLAFFLGRVPRWSLELLLIVAGSASAVVYFEGETLPWFGIVSITPTFICGVCLALRFPPAPRPRTWIKWGPAVLGIAIVVLPFLLPLRARPPTVVTFLFLLVATLGVSGHDSLGIWRTRVLVWLGEVSYSLYMTHAIVISVATRFTPSTTGLSWQYGAYATSACATAIAVATLATYRLVELPCRRAVRRFGIRHDFSSRRARSAGAHH